MKSDVMIPYVVRPGDDLYSIAARMGFDAKEVWAHAKNQELAELRGDGRILAPGDLLYVPQRKDDPLEVIVGVTNTYRVDVPVYTLKTIIQINDNPVANESFTVLEFDAGQDLKTGDDGSVELKVPANIRNVTVDLFEIGKRIRFTVGHLDPLDEPSGIRQRLTNLGYLPRVTDDSEITDEVLTGAICAFQDDASLPRSGQADDATREALKNEHGC